MKWWYLKFSSYCSIYSSLIIYYSPINEMLYLPKLLFLKGISKTIRNLVLYIFREGRKSSFTWNGEVPFQYLKTFIATGCSTLSFVGSQFISLSLFVRVRIWG